MFSFTRHSFRPSLRFGASIRKSSIRTSAFVQQVPAKISSADNHSVFTTQNPNFDLLRTTHISEYNLDAALYLHHQSGAQILSIHAPEDDNKVFGITFRTPPSDSTGVAHILEHSVLCGSRKFKSKEPFVDLLKGSVNTFLNAFTYPDRTCYPVASMNVKDFYNLIDVYMDAVLHPRAMHDRQVLQQEGWHYELRNKNDPLTYKGVVYNEMKGVYSSSDALRERATQEALFPDNAYSVDSGGDPKNIPDLTFEDFQSFHSTTYHPSNSRIYFYGDDNLDKRLEIIHSYLMDYSSGKLENNNSLSKGSTAVIPQVIRGDLYQKPPLQVKYPVEQEGLDSNSHIITVNWLLAKPNTIMNEKDKLALSILNHLLLGTPSAVLRKTLTESQLGQSVTGGGVSDELIQPTFGVGMKGVSSENTHKVQDLILSTLEDLMKNGFDAEAIRASMNSIEFDLREFNTGGFPRGLSLMLGMLTNWIYDRDPFTAVRFEESLNEIKTDLQEGKPLFQDLIRQYFVENGHRVSVVMVPDSTVASEELERERKELQLVKEKLSEEQIDEIILSSAQLKAAQEAEDSPEAKATIPRLSIDDLSTEPREIPMMLQRNTLPLNHDVLVHPLSSSGILYVDLGLDFSGVRLRDVPLLPLFARMLTEAGTTTMDQVTLSHFVGAETGGVSATWHSGLRCPEKSGVVKEDQTDVNLYLMIRGKCTKDKIDKLFLIYSDILLNAQLDNKKRVVEILLEVKARRMNSVVGNGHSYAMSRLAAENSFLGYLGENMGGISYLRAIDELLQLAEEDWPEMQRRLENIRNVLLLRNKHSDYDETKPARVVINLTGDEDLFQEAKRNSNYMLENIASFKGSDNENEDTGMVQEWLERRQSRLNTQCEDAINEGISIPSQVNYVVKGGSLFLPGEDVRGSHAVVSRYLGTGYLWDTIRVMGGAYGGFGRFSPHSGRFIFASYRDPNIIETLDNYDNAGEILKEAICETTTNPEEMKNTGIDVETRYSLPKLSQDDIIQSIIGFVGDLDSPLSVDQKGYTSLCNYIAGETAYDRAKWRREVLETSRDDFRVFAEKLIELTNGSNDGNALAGKNTGVVVVGSQAALDEANSKFDDDKKLKISPAFGSVQD